MKKDLISYSDFHMAFIQANRGDTFSPLGLVCMYDYLKPIEPVNAREIAYQYSEYEDMREFRGTFGESFRTWVDIEDVTTLIPVSEKSFIIKEFNHE